MSDKKDDADKKALAKATKGDMAAKDDGAMKDALKSMGFGDAADAPLETLQTGGVTKWLNLKAFQENPNAGQNEPVKGNGRRFAGILLDRHEIEDEKGEENADGVKVRHFYTFLAVVPTPVEFKNDDGQKVQGEVMPGEVVSLGERHQLKSLRNLTGDGGKYLIVVEPHSRIRIGSNTMWTFNVGRKVLTAPPVRGTLVKPPF